MKILLMDEHILFREGLKYILKNMHPEAEIIEASTPNQAIKAVSRSTDINLIILDLEMSVKRDISALNSILSAAPKSFIVILTSSKRNTDIHKAIHSGVTGYITKCVSPEIMKKALQLVLSGGTYMPTTQIKSNISQQRNRIDDLTPRQTEILKFIVDGNSNKQLANNLGLTLSTVKTHVSAIFRVLNVKNRTQAAMQARAKEMTWIN